MNVRLNIRTARGSLYQREYREPLIRVGRDPSNDLQFGADNDDNVSRFHAQIELREGQAYLKDLASSNGTYINNERVSRPIQIKCGDEIRFGCAGPRATVVEIRSDISETLVAASSNTMDSPLNPDDHQAISVSKRENETAESVAGAKWAQPRQPTRQLLVACEFRARNRWLLTVTAIAGAMAIVAGGFWAMLRTHNATIQAKLETEAEARLQAEKRLSDDLARKESEAKQIRMEEARIQRDLVTKVEEDIKRLANERDQNQLKFQDIEGAIARVARQTEQSPSALQPKPAAEAWEQPEAHIDCPQDNVVLELKSGKRIRGRLEEITSKEVGLKLRGFKFPYPYTLEVINRILTADEAYKFDVNRRVFISVVQYYAFNSVRDAFAPMREKNPKAAIWTRELGSLRLTTGQEMPCLFCKLKSGEVGIGLDTPGVDQLPAKEINQIVTAKGVYKFGDDQTTLEFISFESIRAAQQEKQFTTALVALSALSYGFGRALGAVASTNSGSSPAPSSGDVQGPRYQWVQEPCSCGNGKTPFGGRCGVCNGTRLRTVKKAL